mmetsp:Transcript_19320/g.13872  ORF Transcript_19320/g.13872 Transcript_19320/m.13872 type:complete len:101 (+) Transcript_19320:1245-1547(+)
MKELDYQKNGMINYCEFLSATLGQDTAFLTEEKLMALFKNFDVDDSGFITVQNFKDSFTKFGQDISDSDINTIFKHHDIVGDSRISFQEFKVMMEHLSQA